MALLGSLSREQRAAGQRAERNAHVEREHVQSLQRRLHERDQRAAELERRLATEKRRSARTASKARTLVECCLLLASLSFSL